MSDIITRVVHRRGCGYPKEGGVYVESIGTADGTLPRIVIISPPIPLDHTHLGWVYVDLDAMLREQRVQHAGPSQKTAEDYSLRRVLGPIVRDLFGDSARLTNAVGFYNTARRILAEAGVVESGGVATMRARQVLRANVDRLAPFVKV